MTDLGAALARFLGQEEEPEEPVNGVAAAAERSRFGSYDEPMVEQKLWWESAAYTDEGPSPFVCGQCRHIMWGGHEREGDLCQLVHGPHEGGQVLPGGTCIYFAPKQALVAAVPVRVVDQTAGGPVESDGPDEDIQPAVLTPKEYVLTDEMVQALGGEEKLEALRASLGNVSEPSSQEEQRREETPR